MVDEEIRVMPSSSITTSSAPDSKTAAVLLPLPLRGPYDYAFAETHRLRRGALVRAPLGSRELVVAVWGQAEGGVVNEMLRTASPIVTYRIPVTTSDYIDYVARDSFIPTSVLPAPVM